MNKIPTVCRCYGCKKVCLFETMKPIEILVPSEEGQIKQKRSLCPSCSEKFNRIGFIQKTAEERKKRMEVRDNEQRRSTEGSTKED